MKAATRLRKLRTMSGLELRTRLAAAAYRVYERRTLRGSSSSRSSVSVLDDGRGRSSAPLATARRFLPSVDDLPATRHVLETQYGCELSDSIARADRLVQGELTLFGQARQIGPDVDWHADPVSGNRWPLLYHRDIPIGDRSRAPGDAKDVWELNRQQFLCDLGKAWLVTGRAEYANTIHRLVFGWIEANPYGLGVNWSGPLEVAYRALSWLWAYKLTTEYSAADSTRSAWVGSFRDHGRFLFRHLELYESPFNHLIGEAAVLYVLGVLFPDFRDARRWRHRGRHVLETRLGEQFYPDGGSVEQATVYHHATLGFYLLAALVARRNYDDFASEVWAAIERAIEHSMQLTQPDGRMPAIGDNDDARPFAFDVRDKWDFRYLLAAGAVLFRRPDFKAVAGRMPEDAFWLLGPGGVSGFAEIEDVPPRSQSCVLPSSGYVVLRSERLAAPDYICFDCGELAGGLRTDDVPSAAHGHADALSVVAFLSGQSLLVDPGFYTYDGDRSWERHFRETAAHCTVRVDRADQAYHIDKMAWSRVPRVELENFQTTDSGSWAIASHDGYARSVNGVRHRRTVWLRPSGYVIVYDELVGGGDHIAEIVFQLDKDFRPTLGDNCAHLGDRFAIRWCADAAIVPILRYGEDAADGGWIAPRLGSRVPAARLVLGAEFSHALHVLTTIFDAQLWAAAASPRGSEGALVQALANGTATDVIAASTGSAIATGGYTTDGSIGVWRTRGSHLVEAARVGGTFINLRDPGWHQG